MKSIPIILNIKGLGEDVIEMEANSTMVYYMKKHYLVTVHQGLPIKTIYATLDKKYEFTDFIICAWNDIILIPIEKDIYKTFKLFVFKHFVKKQIDISFKYNVDHDKPHIVKYVKNEFLPINMIPMNPMNIYYIMKFNKSFNREGNAGKPVYLNNKLIGIIGKVEDNFLYVIPSIYILRSIEKNDNMCIYTIDNININDIVKFDKYNVNNTKDLSHTIYFKKMNTLIPLDCYITLEGDVDTKYNMVTKQNGDRSKTIISTFIPYENEMIQNNISYCVKDLHINITSSFIHLIKICYKDMDLIEKIFANMEYKKELRYSLNSTSYTLSF